jgi:autotransporter-associated beta strand protein
LSSASANSLLAKGAFLAAALLGGSMLKAATFTWVGGTAPGDWSTNANWQGGTAPGNGQTLAFGGANTTNTNDIASLTALKINFNTGASAFTLGGNAISLSGSGLTSITNSSTNTQTIDNALTFSAGAQTWNAASGGLDFGGTINNGGFLLTLKGGNNFTFSTTSVVSGTGGLTVNDSGATAQLNAVNTYSGNTIITAGTLQVGSNGSLGSGTYAGTITDNGALQYSSGVGQTLSGIISGTGTLTKDTSTTSTLTLNAVNTYSGNTTVSAGTLQVGGSGSLGSGTYAGTITASNNGTLLYSSSAAQTLSGAINGTGTLTKDTSSTSTLTLSGTNGFTGGLKLNAGTVKVTSNNNLGCAGNVLTFGGGTLEVATSLSTAHSIVVGANSNGTIQIDSGQALTLSSSVLTASNTSSLLTVNGVNGTGNLILGANQTFNGTFDLSNAKLSLAGFNLTVGVLEITGNSVIDFGGLTSSSILDATGLAGISLVMDVGATLTVNNWNDVKEYFYSADNPGATALSQISWGAPYAGDTTKWLGYTDGPGPGHQITPVPEPATYGALFTAAALGLFFWFRLKANAPRLVPVRVAVRY